MVLDPRIPDGLADIRGRWSLDDLVHAHDMLDQLDAIERRRAAAHSSTSQRMVR